MPHAITGFLLNTLIVFHDIVPANRHERRQKAKIGFVQRRQ